MQKSENVDIVAVAKAAKVSISTVSRSFNHPDLVKPATRKRIDRAVRRLGYIRNRAAQAMHGRRSGTIGVVVPTLDHAIFAEVVQAFSDAVDAAGFTLLVASHGYDLEREYGVLRKFLEHRVDGVALIGLEHSAATYELIERQGIPAISMWNYDAKATLSCVGADNREAGALAAQHLLDLGHRDIAVMFPAVAGNDRAAGRKEGALAVLDASCRPRPEPWNIETPYDIATAKQAVVQMLNGGNRPTAILCGNDILAMGALYAARAVGLAVPDDLSITGIGDFRGVREMEPALTTVRLPARRIGQQAGAELARSIMQEDRSLTRTACDIVLIVRDTSKAL